MCMHPYHPAFPAQKKQQEAIRRHIIDLRAADWQEALPPARVPRVVRCKGCGASHTRTECPYCERPAL